MVELYSAVSISALGTQVFGVSALIVESAVAGLVDMEAWGRPNSLKRSRRNI
jgi:hypothetical protein